MNFVKAYARISTRTSRLKDLPLLSMRLVLAYGFFGPAKMKWQNIHGIADWFREMGLPAPLLNAYLSAGVEAAGVVLLVLGLGVRIIVILLLFVLAVAIKTVHWTNGFEAGNNGFEIPLYYMIMLFALLIYGPGRISVDHLLHRRRQRNIAS